MLWSLLWPINKCRRKHSNLGILKRALWDEIVPPKTSEVQNELHILVFPFTLPLHQSLRRQQSSFPVVESVMLPFQMFCHFHLHHLCKTKNKKTWLCLIWITSVIVFHVCCVVWGNTQSQGAQSVLLPSIHRKWPHVSLFNSVTEMFCIMFLNFICG